MQGKLQAQIKQKAPKNGSHDSNVNKLNIDTVLREKRIITT